MTISMAERVFARICSDQDYADAVSRGELEAPGIDPAELNQLEREVLIHDAGLLASETVGFTSQFRVDIDGISAGWSKPLSTHFHESDFNATRFGDARPPGS